jgi:hypothetical protein
LQCKGLFILIDKKTEEDFCREVDAVVLALTAAKDEQGERQKTSGLRPVPELIQCPAESRRPEMTSKPNSSLPVPSPLETRIYTVRGQKVMLDSDLAEVYGVKTSALNQAVDRNPRRFPVALAFRLEQEE